MREGMRCAGNPRIRLVAEGGPFAVAKLVERAGEAVRSEGHDAKILVVAPNRNGKLSLVREWRSAWGGNVPLPRIHTAEEVCLFVLDQTSCEGGRESRPCILNDLEERVLLEDLKVTGLRECRLKGMFSFFKRGISEGREENPSWLINGEERMVFDLLRSLLSERSAMLSCELGSKALFEVRHAGVPASCRAGSVFVLGYSSLDASTQALCHCLAQDELVVTGIPSDPGTLTGTHAHPGGMADLFEPPLGFPDNPLTVTQRVSLRCPDPKSELDEVLERAVEASSCLVVTPNAAWLRSFARAFEERNVKVQVVGQPSLFRGDPRVGTPGLAFVAALGIVADPESVVAWRTYVGLGDWLCSSDAWKALRQMAAESGSSVRSLLLAIRDGQRTSFEGGGAHASALGKLMGRAAEGAALIERCRDLRGSELVRVLAAETGLEDPFGSLGIPLGEGDDAATLYRRLHDDSRDPMPHDDASIVLAMPLTGRYLFAETVFLTGMIEGFLPGQKAASDTTPPEKRERLLAFDRCVFDACAQAAESVVVCSSFDGMGAEDAMRLGAAIEKIFLVDGEKRARVTKSRFLEGMRELKVGERVQ